jgi:hypothetical protein
MRTISSRGSADRYFHFSLSLFNKQQWSIYNLPKLVSSMYRCVFYVHRYTANSGDVWTHLAKHQQEHSTHVFDSIRILLELAIINCNESPDIRKNVDKIKLISYSSHPVSSKYRTRGASPILLFYFAKALGDDNYGLNFRKKQMFDHWPGHNCTLFWLKKIIVFCEHIFIL